MTCVIMIKSLYSGTQMPELLVYFLLNPNVEVSFDIEERGRHVSKLAV